MLYVKVRTRCRDSHLQNRSFHVVKIIDRLHILPELFLSRKDNNDARDNDKIDFCSVLTHPMLPNANRIRTTAGCNTKNKKTTTNKQNKNKKEKKTTNKQNTFKNTFIQQFNSYSWPKLNQLFMAYNALLICACIKHWLDRWTDIYCVSIFFLTLYARMDRKRVLFPVVFLFCFCFVLFCFFLLLLFLFFFS